MANMSNEQMNI